MSKEKRVKCVVVGDGAVGKTCMLVSYATQKFPVEHVPTIFDNYVVNVASGEEPVFLDLFDTAGQEEYDRLRVLAYPGADVFLLCFSIASPTSFANVTHTWVPELSHHAPGRPVLLIGTQVDKRSNPTALETLQRQNKKPVTAEQGQKLAKKIGAVMYLECSALTQKGLRRVFDEAILAVLEPKRSRETSCFPVLFKKRRSREIVYR